MLTPERLAAMRAFRAAITPDWEGGVLQFRRGDLYNGAGPEVPTYDQAKRDAAFIADAPTAIDELLAEIARLEEQVTRRQMDEGMTWEIVRTLARPHAECSVQCTCGVEADRAQVRGLVHDAHV